MAAIRRQGGRNLQDIEVVVLEASAPSPSASTTTSMSCWNASSASRP